MSTAEEVLKARQEAEARRHEELARERKVQLAEQERADNARRTTLLATLATEARSALRRLEDSGFPGGELKMVVAGYKPRRTWWGRRYYTQMRTERACWRIDNSYIGRYMGIYLTSEGGVVLFTHLGYCDRYDTFLNGLHDVADDTGVTNNELEALIERVGQIAA
ncbi:MAG TPA: hypothetical protein PKD68_00555 [Candidatus Saccharibacteria bacterium]|nr:hypothetical protein [Candidatus Saccharibacteria bacterium]